MFLLSGGNAGFSTGISIAATIKTRNAFIIELVNSNSMFKKLVIDATVKIRNQPVLQSFIVDKKYYTSLYYAGYDFNQRGFDNEMQIGGMLAIDIEIWLKGNVKTSLTLGYKTASYMHRLPLCDSPIIRAGFVF
jgi:hypothetical protein